MCVEPTLFHFDVNTRETNWLLSGNAWLKLDPKWHQFSYAAFPMRFRGNGSTNAYFQPRMHWRVEKHGETYAFQNREENIISKWIFVCDLGIRVSGYAISLFLSLFHCICFFQQYLNVHFSVVVPRRRTGGLTNNAACPCYRPCICSSVCTILSKTCHTCSFEVR